MVTMNQRGPAVAGSWTVENQAGVVLRLLHGEAIDAVSEETGVSVRDLDSWRAVFLTAAASALRKYDREVEKKADEERRRKEAEPLHSEFTAVPEPSPSAEKLPVPEHLHYLWVTLGLDDE